MTNACEPAERLKSTVFASKKGFRKGKQNGGRRKENHSHGGWRT